MVLGLTLGFGAVLTWQGLRVVMNRELAGDQRRKGFWRLNGGLVLVALSVVAFGQTAQG